MKNQLKKATVSYRGREVNGLVFPSSVQRLNSKFETPEGYISVGKQRFGNGLKICFIPQELEEEVICKNSLLKDGEFRINGYTTNFDMQYAIEKATAIVKECFAKDSSENHKKWMLNSLKNSLGLNSFYHIIAVDILENNWNENDAVILKFENYYKK